MREVVALVLVVGCAEPGGEAPAEDAAIEEARAFLEGSGLADRPARWEPLSALADDLGGVHVRWRQLEDGVPVLGGQVVVHLDASGLATTVTDASRDVDVDVRPRLVAGDAERIARATAAGEIVGAELVIARHAGEDLLAWSVALDDTGAGDPSLPVVWVDAHDGGVVAVHDALLRARDRWTFDANGAWALPGTLARTEGSAPVGDPPVDALHAFSGTTWDYYWQEQGRDSWDGAGAPMAAAAHYGVAYASAAWNGRMAVFGDGAGVTRPWSLALDLVGHEWTHAVVERSAGLQYWGEAGGLNESYADVFGNVVECFAAGWTVDAGTWTVGEDLSLGGAPPLRSMADPPSDGSSLDDYVDWTPYVDPHFSSGIGNKAFYLAATATDPRVMADVWYRALTVYLTPAATFVDARQGTIAAATDLHGPGSVEVAAVEAAWDAVGVLPFTVVHTVTGLSGGAAAADRFSYPIPAGVSMVELRTTGRWGDLDLYVRTGAPPTPAVHDCASDGFSPNERCRLPAVPGTTVHVLLAGAAPGYSGVTYTAASTP